MTRDLAAITDEYLDEHGMILALILALFTFVNKFSPPQTYTMLYAVIQCCFTVQNLVRDCVDGVGLPEYRDIQP